MSQREQNIKRDIFWNSAGSLVYALSSMALAFFVMHAAGAEDGGIFGFGFSTLGQQMFIIAYFGIRPVQITDVERRCSFETYHRLRIMTVLFAVLCAAGYLACLMLSGRYSLYKAAILFLLALYKILDGYADVYESECQRIGFLYVGGRALCLRTVCSASVLMITLLIGKSLLLAAFSGVLMQMIGCALFNVRGFRAVSEDRQNRETGRVSVPVHADGSAAKQQTAMSEKQGVFSLFLETKLLFLSVFLDFYVFSAAKYAIDRSLGDAQSGVFNILFMPTSIIYLMANFVIKPFMTQLAEAYETHDQKRFFRIQKQLLLVILGLMALSLFGVLLLGRPVLSVLELLLGEAYRGQLTGQLSAFFLIILGGGIYALANLYYYVLIILQKQRAIFLIYCAAALVALLLAARVVAKFGIFGGAVCYLFLMCCLLTGFLLCGKKLLRAWKREGI